MHLHRGAILSRFQSAVDDAETDPGSDCRRSVGDERGELTGPEEKHDPETGLLSGAGMEHALDRELSRAARHEFPVSLVYLEILEDAPADGHLLAGVAEALLASVRAEDRVARMSELRFAVLATEGANSETLARRLRDNVSRRLNAHDGRKPAVVVAAVDCQFDEMTREQLTGQAEQALAAAILGETGIAIPPPSPTGRSQAA
jgi:GGDEF domain-containing protein